MRWNPGLAERKLSAALRREYRSLPRLFWLLWIGTLINKAGNFVLPFLALVVTLRGGSEAQAGLVLSAFGAGSVLGGVTGGILSDRCGRRTTILISMFIGSAMLLCMGVASSLLWLGTFTLFMGWAVNLYRPAVAAMVADVVPAPDQARAYGHLYWVHNLGFAISTGLAGFVAHIGQFALFVLDATTLCGFGVLVLFCVPDTGPLRAATSVKQRAGGLGKVLSDRVFTAFCLLNLVTAFVLWQSAVGLPLDLARHGIGLATYGRLIAINGILIILFQPLITRRITSLPRTPVLSAFALLFGIGFGLNGVVESLPGYALAVAIWTLGEIVLLPTGSAVVSNLAAPELRGRYQGVFAMSLGVAACLGPLVGGVALQQLGSPGFWLACFLLMLLVAGGHSLLGPARAARERRES